MCEGVRRDMVGRHSAIEEGGNSECPKLKKNGENLGLTFIETVVLMILY